MEILSYLSAVEDTDQQFTDLTFYTKLHAIESLEHFVQHKDTTWLKTPDYQHVMQTHGIRLSLRAPYLLHAILAISAAHLASLARPEASGSYWTASSINYQRSLELFRPAVQSELRSNNADAVMMASVIHSLLAFLYSPTATSPKYEYAPSWVMSMQGVHMLMTVPEFRSRIQRGIWAETLAKCERRSLDHRRGLRFVVGDCGNPALDAIRDLCTPERVQQPEMYHHLVDRLQVLPEVIVDSQEIERFWTFSDTESWILAVFVQDVRAENVVARLILMYWYRMYGTLDDFWLADSAKAEGRRISFGLQDYPDLQIQRVLWTLGVGSLDDEPNNSVWA